MIQDKITDQLIYTTVKITTANNDGTASGTGFIMSHKMKCVDGYFEGIVTNKHVVSGYSDAFIELVAKDENNNPIDSQHITLHINIRKNCIFHPDKDIDVCVIPLINEINKLVAEGKKPYYKSIDSKMVIGKESYGMLTAIEDIIMIGHPIGIIDIANCKPVVKKGITATHIKFDYNGKPEFVIDVACFPGSSGSPVFLRKDMIASESNPGGIILGNVPSYFLLGILHAGPTFTIDGVIVDKEIPTSTVSVPEITTMINLGYVIKIEKILEIFDLVEDILGEKIKTKNTNPE